MSGSGAGQQLEEHRQVGQTRDDLLDTDECNVDPGTGGGQPAIALVGDQHDGARLGKGEVGAGDAEVRFVELLPQQAAADGGQRLGSSGRARAGMPRQDGGDALARVMDRSATRCEGRSPAS